MFSDITWMEFLLYTTVLVLFYYLWILISFYGKELKKIQWIHRATQGTALSDSWFYDKHQLAKEDGNDYQAAQDSGPLAKENNHQDFIKQLRYYLEAYQNSSVKAQDLMDVLCGLLQQNRQLHDLGVRQEINQIIQRECLENELNITGYLDLESIWELME